MKPVLLIVAILLLAAGCRTSSSTPSAACTATPEATGAPVAWRALALDGCSSDGMYVTMGGSDPQMPDVRFPIEDEGTIREGFTCLEEGAPIDVDFSTERVIAVGVGIGPAGVDWIVATPAELVMRRSDTYYCGGITPEHYAQLLVVPVDVPQNIRQLVCTTGSPCSGPPRP